MSVDPELAFPVLLPFFAGVLPEQDHFRQVRNRLVGPTPCDAFETAADFSEYSFQKRCRLRSYNTGSEPDLYVSKQTV